MVASLGPSLHPNSIARADSGQEYATYRSHPTRIAKRIADWLKLAAGGASHTAFGPLALIYAGILSTEVGDSQACTLLTSAYLR